MRPDFQPIFRSANDRLHYLDLERCREIEQIALKAAPRPPGPRPEMLRQVLQDLKAAPADEALRERAHDTMRRIYVALQKTGSAEELRMALNAYLDGQGELGAKWITLDVVLRPWGEK